jgi:hypothetical protein
MDLYIDKENLKSFIHLRSEDDFDDCLRMIRRQLHVIYNMDKSVFRDDPEMTQWLLRMGEGRGASEETDTFNGLCCCHDDSRGTTANTGLRTEAWHVGINSC